MPDEIVQHCDGHANIFVRKLSSPTNTCQPASHTIVDGERFELWPFNLTKLQHGLGTALTIVINYDPSRALEISQPRPHAPPPYIADGVEHSFERPKGLGVLGVLRGGVSTSWVELIAIEEYQWHVLRASPDWEPSEVDQ